ncbi:MAG: MliC family protein [Devosia sp.]
MPIKFVAAVLVSAMALSAPVRASETALQLTLTTQSGEFEQRVSRYDCATETPVQVTYVNAAPNFLAIVPVADEPEPLVFVAVLSGSGARYASGKWIWWTKGADASLYDTTLAEDADPVLTCSVVNNIP